MAIEYKVIEGTTEHGSVSLNAQTGEVNFQPEKDFQGVARFQYGIYCNGVLLSTAWDIINIKCPSGLPNVCLSKVPALMVNGNCLEVGDVSLMGYVSLPGILRLYNKDGGLISTTSVLQSGGFTLNINPANIWDGFYVTLEEPGKAESERSNVITVCPMKPKPKTVCIPVPAPVRIQSCCTCCEKPSCGGCCS